MKSERTAHTKDKSPDGCAYNKKEVTHGFKFLRLHKVLQNILIYSSLSKHKIKWSGFTAYVNVASALVKVNSSDKGLKTGLGLKTIF